MRTAAMSYALRENSTERYMTTEEFENEAELVRPMLVATAAHMLGSDSEAEDAAQETLAKLWGMRGKLRSPMAALARAVVRNLCVDTIRRRHAVIVPLSDKQRNMAETVTDNDPFSHVMKVIDLLPEAQQIVIRLRHIDGMSTADIAQLTGTSEAAVRKTLSRARMAVRKHYLEDIRNEQ